MRNRIALISLVVFLVQSVLAQTELLTNGNFEAGTTGWSFAGTAGTVITNSSLAYSGNNCLSLGNVSNVGQGVYQNITIPTNSVYATLNCYVSVTSQNSSTVNTDRLRVLIVDTNQNILAIVAIFYNYNASSSYYHTTCDLAPYIGQTVGIYFEAAMSQYNGVMTGFHVDDVSTVYVTAADLPRNDFFTNRIAVAASTLTVRGTSTYASKEPGEPNHAGNSGGKSLWWTWTPATNGTITMDTIGSSFDTLLAVYTGSVLTNLTQVAANDDISTDSRNPVLASRVKFTAVAGTPYQIAVDGKNGASGAIDINLSFQPDVKPPTVSISSPASGAKVTNSTVIVQGKATDNISVASVQFRLENAAGTNAYRTATGTNTWSATVTNLISGLNTVRVRAYDTSSNVSATVSRSFNYVIVSPLTLTINGSGTVSPNLNGQLLDVGASYKITAKPNTGNIFAGWTGDVSSDIAALTFLMRSNLVLQANFIPNPFIPVAGTYQGLFYETNGATHQSSGFLSAAVKSSGSFTAKIQLAGLPYSFSGQFSATGLWSNSIARKGLTPVSVQLKLDLLNTNLSGQFSDAVWTAELSTHWAAYSKTLPAPQAGKYTLLIPGSEDATTEPGGDGYGTVAVDAVGNVKFSGALSDGTKVTQTATLSDQGVWPFYVSLYSGKGSMFGWLFFANETDNDIHGPLLWTKFPQTTAKFYPAGFTNRLETTGSTYRFTNGLPVLDFTDGQVWFENGNLPASFTNQIALSLANKITNLSTNKLTLTITTPSGLFKGSATDPVSGKAISINGVVLQKLNVGYGFFLGTNQTGRVYFGP